MGKFRNFIYNSMQGRYGIDELYRFLFISFIIVWILNLIIKSPILYYFGFLLAIWSIFRMFSKNYEKRRMENEKYIKIKGKIIQKLNISIKKWKERKTHIYRKCPNCKVTIRLPKKKGKHTCNCPNCKNDFKVKC